MTLLLAKRFVLKREWPPNWDSFTIPQNASVEEIGDQIWEQVAKAGVTKIEDVIMDFRFCYDERWYDLSGRMGGYAYLSIFPANGLDTEIREMGNYHSLRLFGVAPAYDQVPLDAVFWKNFRPRLPGLVTFVYKAAGVRVGYLIDHEFSNPRTKRGYSHLMDKRLDIKTRQQP